MTVFVGTTIADAKQVAQRQLNPTGGQALHIKVIQEPRRGFLGIGRRQAKIDVTIKEKLVLEEKAPKAKMQKTAAQSAPLKVKQDDHRSKQMDDAEPDPAEIKRRHLANIDRVRNSGRLLVDYLTAVCAQLGIEVQPVITDVQAHEIRVDLKTAASGKIIGRHGRRINALEQLSNAFMDYHGAPKTIVILDTANYRQRREETVKKLAQRSVMEVVASGKAVFLDPMPARERKIIHQELENNDHVKTYSHGREPYRSIVIAPKN